MINVIEGFLASGRCCLLSWPEDGLQQCQDGFHQLEVAFDTAFESPKMAPRWHSKAPDGSKHFYDVQKKNSFASVGTQIIGLRFGFGLIIASLPPLPSLKAPRWPSEAPRWPQDGIREPHKGPKMTLRCPKTAPRQTNLKKTMDD